MILLISGASHTGKTKLAQKLMERLAFPYLSLDHLKMGLIRSKRTDLSPESPDADLIACLWPIAREMIKTAIENGQNMIVEGCHIPFNWREDFGSKYLERIRHIWLIMDPAYVQEKWEEILSHANDIERRLGDSPLSPEKLAAENLACLQGCMENGLERFLIKGEYPDNLCQEVLQGLQDGEAHA